jgi:CheY-like chemotaxis protein
MESTKGVGSSFIMTFPVQSGVLTESESSNINKPKSGVRTSPIILIVDDDEVSIASHKTILKSASLEYLIARNGLEAVEMCRVNQGISIVLMDIKMPIMNELEATRKIREFRKDLSIIGVTAYAMIGDMGKAIDAGCDDYITKPIKSALLLSAISKQLEKERK